MANVSEVRKRQSETAHKRLSDYTLAEARSFVRILTVDVNLIHAGQQLRANAQVDATATNKSGQCECNG